MTLSRLPTTSRSVDQRYLIEPLGGPQEVASYLDRFPDAIYNKSLDSHLVKFLYSMLGPAGVGRIRRNYLEARLIFEAHGLELNDLDKFYGNPLQFGRISDEDYVEDTLGLLPQEDWERIRAKDSRYRNRIIDFITGARAGNSPFGMRLVARSGLGHEVEIVENYRAMYDANTDDVLELHRFGKTNFLNEMVVVPRQEVARAEIQKITILGQPTGGSFRLALTDEFTVSIPYNSVRQTVQTALENLAGVGQGNVEVTGGPGPNTPFFVKFIGILAARNLTQLRASDELIGGTNTQIVITTTVQGFDSANEPVSIDPRDQYNLQQAIDRVKPITVIPTVAAGAGTKSRSNWIRATASSEFDEMLRYVTGSGSVPWPPRDSVKWIESGVEHQAPRPDKSLPYQYTSFHNVSSVDSYNEIGESRPEYPNTEWHAIKGRYISNHVGPYLPDHVKIFPVLNTPNEAQADFSLADYAEPLLIDRVIQSASGPISLINGIYPVEYQNLPGVPSIKYKTNQFWSSVERPTGVEYLEIDLGKARAVNFVSMEMLKKPIKITIQYDSLDLDGPRSWQPTWNAKDKVEFNQELRFDPSLNPWQTVNAGFTNSLFDIIYTRYIRIKFERTFSKDFLFFEGNQYPWSIDVRNLRIGRNVSN